MRCRFLPVTAPSQPARAYVIAAVVLSMLPIARAVQGTGLSAGPNPVNPVRGLSAGPSAFSP